MFWQGYILTYDITREQTFATGVQRWRKLLTEVRLGVFGLWVWGVGCVYTVEIPVCSFSQPPSPSCISAMSKHASADPNILLIGTKLDLETEREVDTKKAQDVRLQASLPTSCQ